MKQITFTTLISLTALWIGAARPVHAQVENLTELDPDAIASVLDILVDPEMTAEEISQQLTACLQPIYEDSLPYAPIQIETAFDGDGRPSEPELISPPLAEAERSHLRQLVRAEMALFDCSPVSTGGSPVIDVRLAFLVDDEGFSIAASNEEPAVAGAEVQGDEDLTPVDLTRNERRQVQVRLGIAGSPAGTPDGIFGPRTRDAISKWQDENGFRPTGALTQTQVAKLWADTQDGYETWVANQSKQRPSTTRYVRGSDGCLRYRNGGIVPGQSFKCDAKGLLQGF